MKIHKERQYIVTVNSSYIRFLYDQQTGDKKPQVQILREILEDIDNLIEGSIKWITGYNLPDGSHRSPSLRLCNTPCKSDARRSEERDKMM